MLILNDLFVGVILYIDRNQKHKRIIRFEDSIEICLVDLLF